MSTAVRVPHLNNIHVYKLIWAFNSDTMQYTTLSFACAENNKLPVNLLHVVEHHDDRRGQLHVVYDLLGANFLVVLVLHKDGHELLGLPGHFPSLRGQDTDAVHVLPEAELLVPGKRGCGLVEVLGHGGDEGVDLQGLFLDEYSDVPFAVVAHLERGVVVSHCATSDTTRARDRLGLLGLLEAVVLKTSSDIQRTLG